MNFCKYYRLDGHTPVECDMFEYAKYFEDKTLRKVALDTIGGTMVSTVFLGTDHRHVPGGPPILFETMIFGGPHDEYQERFCTWDEAVAGHAAALKLAQEASCK